MRLRGRSFISYTQKLLFTIILSLNHSQKESIVLVLVAIEVVIQIDLIVSRLLQFSTKLWLIEITNSNIHQTSKTQSESIFSSDLLDALFKFVRSVPPNDGVERQLLMMSFHPMPISNHSRSHKSIAEKSSMIIVTQRHAPMLTVASDCWMRNYSCLCSIHTETQSHWSLVLLMPSHWPIQ